ncbi:carboxymuconolactone decarboxylase family protein [bacterium]|nr:carboxymuconolactone decarboxylase family protein [bacterium]
MNQSSNDFNKFREQMNARILAEDHAVIKRFFGVDTLAYQDGALNVKTKEMLGLCASMVMRCDDCIRYHIQKCCELGVTRSEFFDIFSVALTVGGSIVIPHLRRAVAVLDELEGKTSL